MFISNHVVLVAWGATRHTALHTMPLRNAQFATMKERRAVGSAVGSLKRFAAGFVAEHGFKRMERLQTSLLQSIFARGCFTKRNHIRPNI